MCNTSAKSVIQCKLHIEILDYDWLMNNRVWSGPMKSFVFKSSACPGWRNFSLIAFFLLNHVAFFSNCNWTEWITIQGVFTRVISKSDERESRGRLEIRSAITP